MKLCAAGVCTPNILEDEINVCRELDLLDEYGVEQCNQEGNYTLEASFTLPQHYNSLWWADMVAFEGMSFQLYVTLDYDLECHAEFVTHVYYGTESWMTLAAGSLVLVLGVSWYAKKKCKTACCNGDDSEALLKEIMEDDENVAKGKFGDDGIVTVAASSASETPAERELELPATPPQKVKKPLRIPGLAHAVVVKPMKKMMQHHMNSKKQPKKKKRNNDRYQTFEGDADEVDSVSTHAYKQMLDFSPNGLSHRDEMEKVRQAHFERLRKARESNV